MSSVRKKRWLGPAALVPLLAVGVGASTQLLMRSTLPPGAGDKTVQEAAHRAFSHMQFIDRHNWGMASDHKCKIVSSEVLGLRMRLWEATYLDQYSVRMDSKTLQLCEYIDLERIRHRVELKFRLERPRHKTERQLRISLKNRASRLGISSRLTLTDFYSLADKVGPKPVAGKASANWRDAKGVIRAQIIIDTQDSHLLVFKNNFVD